MGLCLEGVAMTLRFTLVQTQTQIRGQAFQVHTTTQKAKETAFSQAAQVAVISKLKRSRCLKLMFKIKY